METGLCHLNELSFHSLYFIFCKEALKPVKLKPKDESAVKYTCFHLEFLFESLRICEHHSFWPRSLHSHTQWKLWLHSAELYQQTARSCYRLAVSKHAPRLACFYSRHVHHLPMETHVREPVLQSHMVRARLQTLKKNRPFPRTGPKTESASRVHFNSPSFCSVLLGISNYSCRKSNTRSQFSKTVPK